MCPSYDYNSHVIILAIPQASGNKPHTPTAQRPGIGPAGGCLTRACYSLVGAAQPCWRHVARETSWRLAHPHPHMCGGWCGCAAAKHGQRNDDDDGELPVRRCETCHHHAAHPRTHAQPAASPAATTTKTSPAGTATNKKREV